MIKQLKFLFSLFFVGVTALSLASCGGDDDDFGGNCEICSYHTLNSKCTINGQGFHCSTSMAHFLGNTRGSYLNIHMHKDGGLLDISDSHNIDLTISASTGPSIDDIQVGQSLQLDGNDRISYFYSTGVISLEHVDFDRYISGSVTCTSKNGSETTLTFKNVVLQNKKNDEKVTVNGTFICDQFRY